MCVRETEIYLGIARLNITCFFSSFGIVSTVNRKLKVHWHEISDVIDFEFFALEWIFLVIRPAWDQIFFDWANGVGVRIIMRILSMRRKSSFSYWVNAESRLFHTECAQKSLQNYTEYKLEANFAHGHTSKDTFCWKILFLPFYTEYTQEVFCFIPSIRRKSSFSYWV